MQKALQRFEQNIQLNREMDALHSFLKIQQRLPNDLDDLLRFQYVTAVSALDKLVHDLVRVGMIMIFQKHRMPTDKYAAFQISLKTQQNMATTLFQPPEHFLEQEIIARHSLLSFQTPDKIGDALSLIWTEPHKWQHISSTAGYQEREARETLKNIIDRRNRIVHEADFDPVTAKRTPISNSDANLTTDFIDKIAHSIYQCVK